MHASDSRPSGFTGTSTFFGCHLTNRVFRVQGSRVYQLQVADALAGPSERLVYAFRHYNYKYDWLRPTLEEIIAAARTRSSMARRHVTRMWRVMLTQARRRRRRRKAKKMRSESEGAEREQLRRTPRCGGCGIWRDGAGRPECGVDCSMHIGCLQVRHQTAY